MEAELLPSHLHAALGPDEEVRIHARSTEVILAVTSRRAVVAAPERLVLVAVGHALTGLGTPGRRSPE